MKTILAFIFTALLFVGCGSGKGLTSSDNTVIVTTIDLVKLNDDKVLVTLDPGTISADAIAFYIPKTVPGTYSEDNYGKYVEQLKAIDFDGNELATTKSDDNTWNISDARKLDKISYYVNDTYDTEGEQKEAVFSPAGTNILEGENFMLNLHGFVGYFEGLKELPYEINIEVPEGLSATTSLKRRTDAVAGKDSFYASRYFDVIDNPILYHKGNSESFQINDITVTLSVYSPSGLYTAADFRPRMEKMMAAQKSFLGEIDGTREYNILMYLSTMEADDAGGFGALEHHTSTVVVFPEQLPKDRLEEAMVDVVSHEFFHIVTPLNVHSKEIQYFDFNNPKMSEHLWMYEGTTEYFSNLFQIQQGLIDEAEFYNRILDKISNAKSYDDAMSFTTMSKNILDNPYKGNYGNVYEKGALINMVLDISLRELSNGEKGVLWLMKELSRKYDYNTPFEDEDLIDEIVRMTYPEIRTFFNTHVIGDTPIDYKKYLYKTGLASVEQAVNTGYFLRGEIPYIDVDIQNENAIFVRKGIQLNSFFTDLGAIGGDVIKSINGTPIDLEAIRPIIGQSFGWSPEEEITMVVQRGEEEIKLEGKVGKPVIYETKIEPAEDATPAQTKLRALWMKS